MLSAEDRVAEDADRVAEDAALKEMTADRDYWKAEAARLNAELVIVRQHLGDN